MRITTSDNFYEHCGDDHCEKSYCSKHRLLWRYCETVKQGIDDTYIDGRPHYIYHWGDCPECERDARNRKAERAQLEWEADKKWKLANGYCHRHDTRFCSECEERKTANAS